MSKAAGTGMIALPNEIQLKIFGLLHAENELASSVRTVSRQFDNLLKAMTFCRITVNNRLYDLIQFQEAAVHTEQRGSVISGTEALLQHEAGVRVIKSIEKHTEVLTVRQELIRKSDSIASLRFERLKILRVIYYPSGVHFEDDDSQLHGLRHLPFKMIEIEDPPCIQTKDSNKENLLWRDLTTSSSSHSRLLAVKVFRPDRLVATLYWALRQILRSEMLQQVHLAADLGAEFGLFDQNEHVLPLDLIQKRNLQPPDDRFPAIQHLVLENYGWQLHSAYEATHVWNFTCLTTLELRKVPVIAFLRTVGVQNLVELRHFHTDGFGAKGLLSQQEAQQLIASLLAHIKQLRSVGIRGIGTEMAQEYMPVLAKHKSSLYEIDIQEFDKPFGLPTYIPLYRRSQASASTELQHYEPLGKDTLQLLVHDFKKVTDLKMSTRLEMDMKAWCQTLGEHLNLRRLTIYLQRDQMVADVDPATVTQLRSYLLEMKQGVKYEDIIITTKGCEKLWEAEY